MSRFKIVRCAEWGLLIWDAACRDHNVGVAIATDRGLVVPCIKQVQTLSIMEIAEALNTVKSKAVNAQLSKAELSGTTITLSNIGVIGGTYATPLVNPPEIAICALGRLRKSLEPMGDGEAQVCCKQACMHEPR